MLYYSRSNYANFIKKCNIGQVKFVPITRTTIVLTKDDPIPLDVLHLYIPSSSLVIEFIKRLPFGYIVESARFSSGVKSPLSPNGTQRKQE